MVTMMAQTQGALALLPLYGRFKGFPSGPILLRQDPSWTQALKGATRRANEQAGKQPKAASDQQITMVVADTRISEQIRIVVLLSWLVAARCGDTLQLQRRDVEVDPDTGRMMITWRRGKTIAKRGPYTVTSRIPAQHRQMVLSFLSAHTTPTTALFPQTKGKDIKIALRAATGDVALEQRSIRRGSLQLMSAMGLTTAQLLQFSGHTTAAMLMRYLGHGKHAHADQGTMLEAAIKTFG
jgi:integrase